MSNSDYASRQLNKIRYRIAIAADKAKRDRQAITLIGAAKQQNVELIRSFVVAGLQHLGENYLNEALSKQDALDDTDVTWHFIGKLQSNKTKAIAQHFSWVHSLDRFKIAQRLNAHTPVGKKLQTLLQIDSDNEPGKGGVSPKQAPVLCDQISQLENLCLRGFMLLPKPRTEFTEQRQSFASARELMQQCNQRYGLRMEHLSMGMSNDLEAAVAEGSTMIRIGTDLFGARGHTK